MYDLAIVGAGVIGSALAYTLSAYRLKVAVIERENDVAMGASRANTAIVHGGYDPKPSTLMGRLNVEGARRCFELCEKLDVEVRKTGSLVIALDESDRPMLDELYARGVANGCSPMQILTGEEVRAMEPHLSEAVVGALYVPESGVINPWELTLAMAEVAVRNGVELRLNENVDDIERVGDRYDLTVSTPNGERRVISARYVVNAAGVESDHIHNMVAEPAFEIHPTRGEYYLLDRSIGPLVRHVIFQCPSAKGKGVTVSPTIHDNFLVGPNADVIADRTDTAVTREGLAYVAEAARRTIPALPLGRSIRNFAGIRANSSYPDFYVKFAAPNFLDIAAIRSPGLTCAPAMARHAKALLEADGLVMTPKASFLDGRTVVRFKDLSEEERVSFVREYPSYGRVICRCETITEGEILAAMAREIPPVSIDGVKRRCGTGMGRCQGGFCGPRVMEILARERGVSPVSICQDGVGSRVLIAETKGGMRHA
ncbi:MAG: NAD(P)/FAD-dependent oxidoreductase [Saccharofermentanales bacterium]|jgi:glycerol-3-phosphate dehydrogenase